MSKPFERHRQAWTGEESVKKQAKIQKMKIRKAR
jgi:hypothetical protein